MQDLSETALNTIRKYNMLKPGDEVLVGLSGGADSVALFCFLHMRADELGIKLRAAHLEHGLRGEESLRDRRFVENLCRCKGICLEVKSVDIPALAKSRGESIEVCARSERYAFFAQVCGRAKIATAHTASDNAETIMLNLARGTSLSGLCGIPPVRVNIIRPLIECSREAVESFCEAEGLIYVTDSTNLSGDYSRNRIRHQVIPELRRLNPNLEGRLTEMSELLRGDSDLLEQIAEDTQDSMQMRPSPPLRFDRDAYLAAPRPVASRILIRILKSLDLRYDKYRIEQMGHYIREGGAYQLSPDWRLLSHGGKFAFEKKRRPLPHFRVEITKSELESIDDFRSFTAYAGKSIVLHRVDCKEFENTPAILLKNCLDYDKISMSVFLRGRMPKDTIRLPGRGCTKSIRDLYRESGASVSQRERMVIIEAGGTPIWAEGFGVSEQAAPTKDSLRILRIEVVE